MDNLIGLEFELERSLHGLIDNQNVKAHFKLTEDGSLQHGLEFVLNAPRKGKELEVALRAFEGAACPILSDHATERCSLHVHINVKDMTPAQKANFVGTAAVLDNVLFALTGNIERSEDVFCVPLIECLMNPVDAVARGKMVNKQYTSIAVSAIHRHGSLEFRHFAIPRTMEDVRNIIKAITSIKEYVGKELPRDEILPVEFFAQLSGKGPKGFVLDILGDNPIVNTPVDWVALEAKIFDAVSVLQVWVDEFERKKEDMKAIREMAGLQQEGADIERAIKDDQLRMFQEFINVNFNARGE